MQITNSILRLTGSPVGVSLINGQGTSGIFCGVQNNDIMLIEYLYQDNFALKHYPVTSVRNIMPFPPCSRTQPANRAGRLY